MLTMANRKFLIVQSSYALVAFYNAIENLLVHYYVFIIILLLKKLTTVGRREITGMKNDAVL